jgi:hypothetical protein
MIWESGVILELTAIEAFGKLLFISPYHRLNRPLKIHPAL